MKTIGSMLVAQVVSMMFLSFAVIAEDETRYSAVELQSQLMSFTDQLITELGEATNEYLYQGQKKSPRARAAVAAGRVNISVAAVSIAAGKNIEVSLLDLIVLVELLTYTVEDAWIPKVLGAEGEVYLKVFSNLRKRLWQIADGVLTDIQEKELKDLLAEWRRQNKGKLSSVADVRFSAFSKNRHSSSLFAGGKPGGFLKKVSEATQEIERTRILAERAIYLAERQPKLIGWRIEQIFYALALSDEFKSLLHNTTEIPRTAGEVAKELNNVSTALEKIYAVVDLNSNKVLQEAVENLSKVSSEVVSQAIDKLLLKLFLWALALFITFSMVLLCFKYASLKIERNIKPK
jgi:hypothetical protein